MSTIIINFANYYGKLKKSMLYLSAVIQKLKGNSVKNEFQTMYRYP